MQRATGLASSIRAYSGGGTRTVIDAVDDKTLMQETNNARGMKGEVWPAFEAPQNYGFSSVVMDAKKEKDGQIKESAEGFISFMGGGRSFPVCMVMDDRRHRLKELEKGDVAMFRTSDDRQQIHMTSKGTYWSTRDDRVNRIAMVPPPQQNQQQSASTTATGESSGQSGQGQQQQKANGQKAALEDNKKSKIFVDQSKSKTHVRHNDGNTEVTTNDVANFYKSRDDHSTIWNDSEGIKHRTKKNIKNVADQVHSTTAAAINHNGPTGVVGNMGVSGGVTASSFAVSSDARLKSDVSPSGPVLDKVMALKMCAFNILAHWIDDDGVVCIAKEPTRVSFGLIAQDVQEIFPDLVEVNERSGFLGLRESKIGVVAVAALQEYVEQTNAKIAALMQRIEQLERHA